MFLFRNLHHVMSQLFSSTTTALVQLPPYWYVLVYFSCHILNNQYCALKGFWQQNLIYLLAWSTRRTAWCTEASIVCGVRQGPDYKGLLYASLPCISARGIDLINYSHLLRWYLMTFLISQLPNPSWHGLVMFSILVWPSEIPSFWDPEHDFHQVWLLVFLSWHVSFTKHKCWCQKINMLQPQSGHDK